MLSTLVHSLVFSHAPFLVSRLTSRPYEGLDGGLSYSIVVRKKRDRRVHTVRGKSLHSDPNRIANSHLVTNLQDINFDLKKLISLQ